MLFGIIDHSRGRLGNCSAAVSMSTAPVTLSIREDTFLSPYRSRRWVNVIVFCRLFSFSNFFCKNVGNLPIESQLESKSYPDEFKNNRWSFTFFCPPDFGDFLASSHCFWSSASRWALAAASIFLGVFFLVGVGVLEAEESLPPPDDLVRRFRFPFRDISGELLQWWIFVELP